MASFLDFDNPEVRTGLGLLALGQMPKSQGFAGLLDIANARDTSKRMQAKTAMENAAFERQKQEWMAADQAARAAAAQRAAIPSLFTLGPAGEVAGFDTRRAIELGLTPKQIEDFANVRNVGRSEVARTVEGLDEQGRPTTFQFDKFGNRVGDGLQQWKAPISVNQGDKTTFVDAVSLTPKQSFAMGMSPEARDASARGWASNALARERLNFDMSGGAEAAKPQFRDGMWVTPPARMQPGQAIPATGAGGTTAQKEAAEALNVIEQARQIIPKATGSYIGAGVDALGRAFGASTGGDIATGQLQALEGALVAKMPKMTGPQSDKDVALYRQMAGVIGDPTIPQERKLAALQVVEQIQQRYAGPLAPKKPAPGALGSGSFGATTSPASQGGFRILSVE